VLTLNGPRGVIPKKMELFINLYIVSESVFKTGNAAVKVK
jgi:hypothetical protein